MGIKIPLHKKKGGDKVADLPPPVFNKHGSNEELLKGHKAGTAGSTKPKSPLSGRAQDALNGSTHSLGGGSNQSGTSSTALWIAASNAQAAKQHQGKEKRNSDGAVLRQFSSASDDYDDDDGEEEYYEEEIVEEEFFEEEVIDELPPRKITIRFDEFDEMQTILHINDYTKHEISRSWYKRDDYDKMVALARKTAEKVEERTRELGRKIDKNSKKIEYRGLEAWTSMGAAKVKILKESAVEAVWNEQSRQWDLGINDVDRIREVYQVISKGAQQIAQDRGFSDELIAKRIRQIEFEEAEKKRKRKLLGKSKALLGKSVKVTAGGVVKTAKLGVKTTKLTGKVALKTTMVATKTAVATATLDRKMFKEAIIPAKKRECEKQTIRLPSQATTNDEKEAREGMEGMTEDDRSATDNNDEADDDVSMASEAGKKKSKLKLLGVVPIPGTHKTYREDRRQERIEKRITKQKTRPSWEQNVAAGKY
mmetsp:Transcript_21502/g.61449  ORF Transcript_21502/g.61449 Transcript_21502/m.61449 type:complete len:480 (+) Transcript_21502:77-1516(+)